MADLLRRERLLKPFSTDSETIKPYFPRNMPSISIGLHLSLWTARCLVSFCFYFEYNFLYANCVDPYQTPRSEASDLGPLCFPMSLLWDTRNIWFNTVRFYCNSGNHRHVFPEESANQIHLNYFYSYFCNAKRNKNSHIRLVQGDTNKTQKWVPLRAMKTFIRKKIGHTT